MRCCSGPPVMVATTAVTAWCSRPSGWRALTPMWAVPSIPFLGMHVSNYALVLPGYVLVAAGAVVLLTSWPAHGGMRASPGDWICNCREREPKRAAAPAAVRRARFAAVRCASSRGTQLTPWGSWGEVYELGIRPVRAHRHDGRQRRVLFPAPGWSRHPGIGGDVRRRLFRTAEAPPKALTNAGRCAALAVAVALVTSLIGSLLIDYPVLETVNLSSPPPISRYLGSAALSALTWPRLRHHDFLLSTSFWGAFGWLNRLLPEWAITVCVTVSSMTAIALLVSASRRRDAVLMKSLAVVALGSVASFLAYVVVTLEKPPDVHGRYLLRALLVRPRRDQHGQHPGRPACVRRVAQRHACRDPHPGARPAPLLRS